MKSAKFIIKHVVSYLNKLSKLSSLSLTSAECQTFTDIEYNKNNNLIERYTESTTLDNLLSTITYKEKEESIYATDYYKVLTEYFDYDIYENTGLTIDKVLSMDSELYEDLLSLLIIKLQEKNRVIEELKQKHNKHNEQNINNDIYDEYDLSRLNSMYKP
jgi:hypothetical protein